MLTVDWCFLMMQLNQPLRATTSNPPKLNLLTSNSHFFRSCTPESLGAPRKTGLTFQLWLTMPHHQTKSLHENLGRISRREADEAVRQNGFFLGASRDFWVVLSTSAGSILLCFLATFLTVELQTRRRKTSSKEVRKLPLTEK